MKICSKCGVAKELSEFSRKKSRDAHNPYCKACSTAHALAYRKAHAEKIRAYNRERERRKAELRNAKINYGLAVPRFKFKPYQAKPSIADLEKLGDQELLDALQEIPNLIPFIKFMMREAPHRPSIYEDLVRLAAQHDPAHVKQQL